jgi:hypothetical protein
MAVTLLALASPVPVVVRSMPSVNISHWPPADALAWAALWLSCGSVVVALVTLASVWLQINIAKAELEAVKADFKLSQEQFDLSQQQFGEIMKRPILDVQMVRFGDPTALETFSDNSRARVVTLGFFVTNSGDAVARDVLLEIFVPLDQLVTSNRWDPRRTTPLADDVLNMVDNVPHPDGIMYGRFLPNYRPLAQAAAVVYPKGGYHMMFQGTFLFKRDCESTGIRWRAFDQYTMREGTFPEMRLIP